MADIPLISLVSKYESNSASSCDLSDALILAIHVLNLHVKGLKFKRKIYILTDGSKIYSSGDNQGI